jgi:ribosomal protein S27AE
MSIDLPDSEGKLRGLRPIKAFIDEGKMSGELRSACKACGGSLFYKPDIDVYTCGKCGWRVSMLYLLTDKGRVGPIGPIGLGRVVCRTEEAYKRLEEENMKLRKRLRDANF